MVFDLKDDGRWPFGFKPHPALEIHLAFASETARARYVHISGEVYKQEILIALKENFYDGSDIVFDIFLL